MLIGFAALEKTDWSRLHHAYGRATDTPRHLRALLEDAAAPREKAISHLFAAIIHQGTPWTATGPVALVIAGFLAEGRINHGDEVLRVNLLSFLVSVAEASQWDGCSIEELERIASRDIDARIIDVGDDEALYENEEAANALYARSILGCIRVAPTIMEVMLRELDNANPLVRAWAAMGATTLAKSGPLHSHAQNLEVRLLALAKAAQDTDERSALVMALGELGAAPVAFLNDPSPAVRMCAALAPSLVTNEAALAELLHALEHHAASIDNWFIETPPQFPMRPRFNVVARLVKQITDFERLAGTAVAVAGITSKHCADFDWGPLLAAAFPDGSGIIKTEAQRRYLDALVKNSEIWDPKFGNAYKWFKKAGLSYDRRACEKLLRKTR